MLKNLYKFSYTVIIMILLLLLNNVLVLASNEEIDKGNSFFVGLKASYNSFGGDFDGESDLFRSIGPVCYGLYEFEDSIGEGIVFGASNDLYTVEFSYSQSKHEIIEELDLFSKSFAELKSLDITIKFFSPKHTNKRFKPYGQIGYGLTQLIVENGACDSYNTLIEVYPDPFGEFGDAKYTGYGWHLGFGFICKINNKLSLDTSIAYHRITFDEVKMFDHKYELPENDVQMANTVASIGLKYYFK